MAKQNPARRSLRLQIFPVEIILIHEQRAFLGHQVAKVHLHPRIESAADIWTLKPSSSFGDFGFEDSFP